jgi:hypothetical protein
VQISIQASRCHAQNGTRANPFRDRRHPPNWRGGFHPDLLVYALCDLHEVDTVAPPSNNPSMPKPETVRRIKSYSAASGYVYQYQFQDAHPAKEGSTSGNEYVYYVSADRKTMFPIRIFVPRDSIERWSKKTGRALTGTEEYAVAKMRLFQALDEIEDFATSRPKLTVEESDLGSLLERLDL